MRPAEAPEPPQFRQEFGENCWGIEHEQNQRCPIAERGSKFRLIPDLDIELLDSYLVLFGEFA
jgi:hypothetical protein